MDVTERRADSLENPPLSISSSHCDLIQRGTDREGENTEGGRDFSQCRDGKKD